jgi:predicted unusual protein kinase regulating ubiquinone biosynthesis (AarF/ABC1/UbiB family)
MTVRRPGSALTHAQIDDHNDLAAALQVLTALAKLALLQIQHSSKPPAGTSYAGSVRQLVSELGVLWVKLGQTLSVRPDLVGKRLAAALAGLQVRDWGWSANVVYALEEANIAACNLQFSG